MPRGPSPAWRARKEPVLDDYIHASVNQAGGKHNKDGHYAELVIRDLDSREEATEWKNALYRCALYLQRNGVLDVSMHAEIERDGDKFAIRYKAVDKTHARAHVMAKYGTDRTKWPYDPRRKGAA